LYPRVGVDAAGSGVVSQAGGVTLVEALRVSGLDAALSQALARWRKPAAVHDPAKVVCDLALTLAVGGDCLADVAVLRAEPGVYWAGGLGSDRVTHDRCPRGRRAGGAEGDRRRPGRGTRDGVGPGRAGCPQR
jgi:hypothetical protein